MSREDQEIIRVILIDLRLEFNEGFDDTNRSRFQIIGDYLPPNVFFNIPKNSRFVFQLIFENGNGDVQLRDQIADHLSYPLGGGSGSGGYLSIYLPSKVYLEICESNVDIIAQIIRGQMNRVLSTINGE